jgi:hypothetical protein
MRHSRGETHALCLGQSLMVRRESEVESRRSEGTSVMKRVRIALTGIGLAFAVSARATADSPHVATVWGAGNDGCSRYLQEYAARPSGRFAEEISWLEGSLTALNVDAVVKMSDRFGWEKSAEFDLLKHADVAGLEAWVLNYCRANTIKNLNDAAAAFMTELADQRTR